MWCSSGGRSWVATNQSKWRTCTQLKKTLLKTLNSSKSSSYRPNSHRFSLIRLKIYSRGSPASAKNVVTTEHSKHKICTRRKTKLTPKTPSKFTRITYRWVIGETHPDSLNLRQIRREPPPVKLWTSNNKFNLLLKFNKMIVRYRWHHHRATPKTRTAQSQRGNYRTIRSTNWKEICRFQRIASSHPWRTTLSNMWMIGVLPTTSSIRNSIYTTVS